MQSDDLALLKEAQKRLLQGFSELPDSKPPHADEHALKKVLLEVGERLQDNYPYFHPLYAGQMLKPPHAVARLAYSLALWINPNNHALDGGRASSVMEKEAVAQLAAMIGWQTHLGHLTSGGTMANLEALYIAGQSSPGRKILASQQAHYTHSRLSGVLGLEFEPIPSDRHGRLSLDALEARLARGDVGTVVVTMGTTGTGSVDPLPQVLQLQKTYGFRVHADAAYGGYFVLAENLGAKTRHALGCLDQVDSVVIDPHKHGLQPYGCGCVLFKDPSVGRFYKHDSPYTYFSSSELHLGEISLECSRPGAAAVALWATQKLFPLVRGGEFSLMLAAAREAALAFYQKLANDSRFLPCMEPELDIVVWAMRASRASESSERARKVFAAAAKNGLHLALTKLPGHFVAHLDPGMIQDEENLTCLRSVLMKPEHRQWLEVIWQRLTLSADQVLARRDNTD